MRFAEPWALVALILVPLVFVFRLAFVRRQRRQLAAAGDPDLIQALTDDRDRFERARNAQAVLFALALALTVVALARPQLGMRTEIRRGRGMDVVVALDLSRSMHARDVVPSRLRRAKIELGVLIDRLRGDRVGLVGFTSVGLPLCPLTVDHAALRIQLDGAEPDDLPRGGTSVASAIRAGQRMLEAAGHPDADRAIVILTDGEAHMGDPVQAAADACKAGIVVHVAGVGSRVGEPIPEVNERGEVTGYIRDASGKTVVSRLDEETLRSIATAGGGKTALPAADGGLDLDPITRQLSSLRKTDLEERTVRVYEERYAWTLVPAFLLLLMATLIRPTRRSRLPQVVLNVGFLLCCASQTALAQEVFRRTHPKVEEGLTALEEGRSEDAKKAFEEASQVLGRDPRLTYNQALADAARGELDEAMQGFRAAAQTSEDPNLRARARLGLGNALRKLKKYGEAASAYREALLDDPSVDAARRNLELAQHMRVIQAAQPKSNDGDGESDPDGDDEDQSDEGERPDAGTGGDGGHSDRDGGQDPDSPDGGPGGGDGGSDPAGSDGGENSGGGTDAGTGEAGGWSGGNEDGGDGADAGQPPSQGPDAGPEEAGAGGGTSSPNDEPPPDLTRQEAEALLDALQAEEKALERRRLLESFKGKPVEKDW